MISVRPAEEARRVSNVRAMGSRPTDQAIDSWMDAALVEARRALEHDDVPVGAVVADIGSGDVVAARGNEREAGRDPTAHAEMLALRDAAHALGRWRLDGLALVVTLEPCPMCAGAAWAARIPLIVFGAADAKAGASGSLYNFATDPRLNHTSEVLAGVRADECGALLVEFFTRRRGPAIP
jgi:tRNA(adenine34) deaminase